jgi:hypothetical protein
MDTRTALPFVNLFMRSLENFLKFEDSSPDLWFRIIDDIFL